MRVRLCGSTVYLPDAARYIGGKKSEMSQMAIWGISVPLRGIPILSFNMLKDGSTSLTSFQIINDGRGVVGSTHEFHDPG